MAMLGYEELLVSFLLFIAIHYWKSNRNSPLPNWPIVGMLWGIWCNMSNFHDYITLVLQHYGGTTKFKGPWFTNMDFLIISDPLNVQHITSKNYSNYEKGPEFHEIFDVFGDGIVNSDSEKWKSNRILYHSLFTQNRYKKLVYKTIEKEVRSSLLPFLNHASNAAGTEVDLQEALQRLTYDNICMMALGFETNSVGTYFSMSSEVAYKECLNDIGDAILYRHIVPRFLWKLQKWLQIGPERKLKEADDILSQFLNEQITSKRNEYSKHRNMEVDELHFDLLTALLEQEEGKAKFDDKFLRDTILNIFLAGRDTIGAGLTWFFWLVATHPEVEAKIVEEMRKVIVTKEENWRALSVEELGKLVYLHGAICETLRLYPPAPFEHLYALNDDVLPSGHIVKKNEMVLYSLYSMGRMKNVWGEDCLKFKPERWISEKGRITHVPSYKFIAFNTGQRNCMGKDTAFITMKMVASALLWNYHLEVMEGHQVSTSYETWLEGQGYKTVDLMEAFHYNKSKCLSVLSLPFALDVSHEWLQSLNY
ncbi:hypothetical protein L6164_001297 [Bauhinia variegata]|uniref:Uncharacterized protein n=1 Tax=Bauhinia variegata TaxID=167791 RepID=A0ACB9Q8Z6_BAUVA|nr:hypothetical protein L6164_001297 [Bauhinia variegata]